MDTQTFEDVLEREGKLFYKSCGVSMMLLIREGRDFIIIKKRPEERLKKYDVALYRRPYIKGRGEYVLHRVLKVNNDGTYWIVGDNCTSGETVLEEHILGTLEALKRKGKNTNLKGIKYKLYVYLWCAPYRMRFFVLEFFHLVRKVKRRIKGIIKKLKKA